MFSVSVEVAALLAQIYPTFVVALVLEGHLHPRKGGSIGVLRTIYYIRFVAIATTIGATLQCVFIVANGEPSSGASWLLSISGGAILLSVSFLAGAMMGEAPRAGDSHGNHRAAG
jgi:hypothetical protein